MSSKSNTVKMFEDPNKYAFILYSYKDNEIASSNFEIFNQLGVNIDPKECHHEPIHSFSTFERKIRNSTIFIPFLTPNALDCRNFNRGVCLAATFGVPILPIYLAETNFNDNVIYSLIKEQSILQYELSDEEYENACTEKLENITSNIQENKKIKPFRLIKNLFKFTPNKDSSSTIFLGSIESSGSEMENESSASLGDEEKINNRLATINVEGASGIFTRTWESIKNSLLGSKQPSSFNGIRDLDHNRIEEAYLCFSHEDIDLIFDDFGMFLNLNIPFTFSDEIEFNSKSFGDIEPEIKNSSLFIFYVSQKSIESNRTNRELIMADLFNIPICFVFLEEINEIPSSFEEIFKNKVIIPKYKMNQQEYFEVWL